MKNSSDNVFDGIPVEGNQSSLFAEFLNAHDFAPHTRKAFTNDVRKFAHWFASANSESFEIGRVTVRDVADFREYLRRDQNQAVATVNRAVVCLRRFFAW